MPLNREQENSTYTLYMLDVTTVHYSVFLIVSTYQNKSIFASNFLIEYNDQLVQTFHYNKPCELFY